MATKQMPNLYTCPEVCNKVILYVTIIEFLFKVSVVSFFDFFTFFISKGKLSLVDFLNIATVH